MEGPSLVLAAEQLRPFVGQKVKKVNGNTHTDKERLLKKEILAIFSYGKYLIFQFDTFAIKIHFLLWGTFEAIIEGKPVTGDYTKKGRTPRLSLFAKSGTIHMYNCSVVFVEDAQLKKQCDFTKDIMSSQWDDKQALRKMRADPASEIADVLLDQNIFMGVGNIIKNEVLLLAGVSPLRTVKQLSLAKLKKIIAITRAYVFQFYKWRKKFELRKHYKIYRQSLCKQCGSKVLRMKTGMRKRISYLCPVCQE